ncbi:MAG: hypothetical protein H7Z41_02665, partial [Cytophagales bacterium]|nr:hypothetical protein [Armatimonadota bacterium]
MNENRGQRFRLALWLLVLLGFCAAMKAGINRANAERENRRVEITLDFNELRNLAAAEGVPLSTVLSAFRNAAGAEGGATSVAVQEDTVSSLEEAQQLAEINAGSRGATLLYGQAEAIQRVEEALRVKTRYTVAVIPSGTPPPFGVAPSSNHGLRVEQPSGLVRGMGLGLAPESVSIVRGAGLGIVGRVNNWGGVAPAGVAWTVRRLKQEGVSTVIFSGDAVLGFKGFVTADQDPLRPSTESAIRDEDLRYGTVEFGKQKGDPLLSRALPERLVRVHTILGAEMQSADIPGNVQRFLLAARERNIRCLYVRLFLDEPEALAKNVQYVQKIVLGLKRGGLAIGAAHGYPPLHTSWRVRG